jgi:hypothetical protein
MLDAQVQILEIKKKKYLEKYPVERHFPYELSSLRSDMFSDDELSKCRLDNFFSLDKVLL